MQKSFQRRDWYLVSIYYELWFTILSYYVFLLALYLCRDIMQHAVPRVPLYPGVPHDLQRYLVNAAAICVATGFDIERCFNNSP